MILTLEQQVCSLESAKRLKKWGLRQDSLYKWWKFADDPYEIRPEEYAPDNSTPYETYSALTASELGEVLPVGSDEWTGYYRHFACWNHGGGIWQGAYVLPAGEGYFNWQEGNSMVNCMSKMLIYLLEQGLIKPKEKI